MHTRLQLLIKEYSLTSARFAEILGIQPSAVSHLISGRNKPGFDILSKILGRFPEVNPRWLILGEDPMYLTSPGNQEQISENSLLSGLYTSRPVADMKESPGGTFENIDKEDKKYDIFTATNPRTSKQIQPKKAMPETDPAPGAVFAPGIDRIIIFYSDGTFESFTSK